MLPRILPFSPRIPKAVCIPKKHLVQLSAAASDRFPHSARCHAISYPGELTMPIYLLPLESPFPSPLQEAVDHLHDSMRADYVPEACIAPTSGREHFQTHLWIANNGFNSYQPIGQAVFLGTPCRQKPGLSSFFFESWRLCHAWLIPAYRNQKIFQSSMPSFRLWHPGFQVLETSASLRRALNAYSEHLGEAEKSLSWA